MSSILSPAWREACQRNRDAIPQLAWLTDLRDSALGVLGNRGLPDSGQEDWRYTNLADYLQRGAGLAGMNPPANETRPGNDLASQMQILLSDGRAVSPTAGDPGLPAGVEVHSLREIAPGLRDRAVSLLAGEIHAGESPALAALNLALLSDGLYLRSTPVAGGKPPALHLRLAGSSEGIAQLRLLVDMEPGSRLNLIIEHHGPAGTLANSATRIRCGAGSHLDLLRIQDLPGDCLLTETTQIELETEAALSATSLDFGGQLVRQDLAIALSGPGASANIHGAFLVDGQRHVDNHTTVEHRAPDTASREIFHGLAAGHGRGVFNGRIIVRPGAARTASSLNSRNLLLGNAAEIDTKPELEIYTDDVRCSHGATTGQLDANALFYLRSRGLGPEEARQALMIAFLHATLALIEPGEVSVQVAARLQARLAALDGVATR
ncbi:MAG: Fe-S cluster assembly protein SufD [Gammaproteobacteria bacterium]|nr:Fe-S cluster assembly protein SufD [Gammaproteobacteria bacterium]